jgi:hypothetical protein
VVVNIPNVCLSTGVENSSTKNNVITVHLNPFLESIIISLNDVSLINKVEFKIYNTLGKVVQSSILNEKTTTVESSSLPKGIYFYKLFYKNTIIQSGKLLSNQ